MRGEKNVKDTRRNFPFEIPTIPSVAIVLLAPLLFEHSRLEINKIAQRNVISSPRRDDLIGPCYWSILDFSIITRDGSATRPQTERERERLYRGKGFRVSRAATCWWAELSRFLNFAPPSTLSRTFVLEIETTMVSPSIPVVTKYRVVSEIVNKIVSAVA